jgi:hypothetical protein
MMSKLKTWVLRQLSEKTLPIILLVLVASASAYFSQQQEQQLTESLKTLERIKIKLSLMGDE